MFSSPKLVFSLVFVYFCDIIHAVEYNELYSPYSEYTTNDILDDARLDTVS